MTSTTRTATSAASGSLNLMTAAGLLFVSGAAALLYEVAWFRRLQLVFGVSAFAIGAVVAAFMLGLAFGSRWAASSQWVRRFPLRSYAVMELTIAAYAVLFPLIILAVESAYVAISRTAGEGFGRLVFVRFLLSLLALLPPTFAMGATLPAMAQAVSRQVGPRGAGVLYAFNTLGGVAGTLLAGFYALEHLGISRTQWIGIGLNLLAALLAVALSRSVVDQRGVAVSSDRTVRRPAVNPPEWFPWATLFITGFAAMAGQVLWTRALVFFVHNSTYAFSSILAVSLAAIALGSVWGGRIGRNHETRFRSLVICLGLLTVSTIVAIGIYRNLGGIANAFLGTKPTEISGLTAKDFRVVDTWLRALLVIVSQVASVVALPAFLSGAIFPLAVGLVWDKEAHAATSIGKLYTSNAIGSVVGTLIGAFFLVAWIGTRWALLTIALLPLLPFLWGSIRVWPRGWPVVAGATGILIAVAVFVVAPAGFYRQMFESRFGEVTWFSEGAAETIAICRHPDGSEWIHYSDGRGASGTTSYRGGWLYAHLPLLLHPDPQSTAVICFGTGNTLGAASLHELQVLDGIELSSEVVKASSIFGETNHRVASNPDVRILIDDGRNYLLRTNQIYDVITEEPPLIHTAGVVNLYSKDFYQLCSKRLSDNGVMAVWLATWELMEPETQMLVRAFVDAFPHTSAWDSMHPGEWILIGSKAPLQIDMSELSRRMEKPRIREDLERIGLKSAEDLLSLHLKGDAFLREFCSSVQPVTDDRSVVDYTIPRHGRSNFGLGEGLTGGVRVAGLGPRGLLSELRVQPFDRIYVEREGVSPYLSPAPTDSTEVLVGRLQREREARSGSMLSGLIAATAQDLMNSGLQEDAFQTLTWGRGVVRGIATADLYAMEAVLELRRGRAEAADAALKRAIAIDPDNRIVARILNPNQAGAPIHLGTTKPSQK